MEELEKKLFEAAASGSITSLRGLLKQDPFILERNVSYRYSEMPLHIAAMLGHADFVREVVRIQPQLANELNSMQSSPLHLASSKGHVDVVKVLLSVDPRSRLARDRDGMTALHLAAVKGRIEVLNMLLVEAPDATQLMVHRGDNILHLCIKHYQLEALKLLMGKVHDCELVNAKDGHGNTLLHLAVGNKQVETIEYLLSFPRLDVNAQNSKGMTAVDVLFHSRRDMRDAEIQEMLKDAGGHGLVLEVNTLPHMDENFANHAQSPCLNYHRVASPHVQMNGWNHRDDWLDKKRGALMIVASLIATVAFQVGVNPVGGVWQDDSHEAGVSILAHKNLKGYNRFYAVNTVSFISSLSIILLLMSGLPMRRRFFMWILMVVTWIAITATALVYLLGIFLLTPESRDNYVLNMCSYAVVAWLLLMFVLLIGHTMRMIVRLVKKLYKALWKRPRATCSEVVSGV